MPVVLLLLLVVVVVFAVLTLCVYIRIVETTSTNTAHITHTGKDTELDLCTTHNSFQIILSRER